MNKDSICITVAVGCAISTLAMMGTIFQQDRRIEELEDTLKWMLKTDLEEINGKSDRSEA